jgi:hypothetical protein
MATWSWSESVDTLYTTTWVNRKKKVVQQIYKRTPLFNFLMKKGNVRQSSGGRYIEYPLSMAEATGVSYITKGSRATMVDMDHLRTARVPWKTLMGELVRYRQEEQQNRGTAKLLDMVEAKYVNLELSMKKQLEANVCLGTGTYTTDAFYGMTDWVPQTNTNTVAGINRTTYTWFKNTIQTATTTASVNLVLDMRTALNNANEYDSDPDFILTTQTIYEIYQNAIPVPELTTQKVGDAEYKRFAFNGIPIDYSTQCTSGNMYILDTDHIWFEIDPYEDWKMTDWKEPHDMPFDRAAQIILTGNMCCDMPVVQTLLHTIA